MRDVYCEMKLQDRANSKIANARLVTSLLNVGNLFCYDRNVMTCKILNKLSPESHWDNINRALSTRPATRGTVKTSKPLVIRLIMLQKGFNYTAFKTWNDTPKEIRALTTLGFSKTIRKVSKEQDTENNSLDKQHY